MTMIDTAERPDVIRVHNVSKKFTVHKDKSLKERIVNAGRSKKHEEIYWALKDVDFTVKAGESIGLAGANGSGKSTLLKVIGGILTPDAGAVGLRGRLAALLELGAGFHPDLTGRENVYLNGAILGLSEEEIDSMFDDIVDFSGIRDFIDTQVKFYSSGMYVRLAFAVAIHSKPDILLVDEVLAVGDEPFQRKCMDKIHEFQANGGTIILVSHSADQIIEVCDRAVVLDKGNVVTIGDTRDAMSRLHQGYAEALEGEMAQKRASEQAADELPATIAKVQISQGLLTAPDGLVVHISGDTLVMSMDVRVPGQLANYGVSLEIETTDGTRVFGMDSQRLQLKLPELTSDGRVNVTLPHIALGEDDYLVSMSLLASDGSVIDRIERGTSFTTRSDGMTSGYVKAFPEVSVDPDVQIEGAGADDAATTGTPAVDEAAGAEPEGE